MEKCKNGKCDLRDQTSDSVLEFLKSNSEKGFLFCLYKDEKEPRGMRKDIIKNISYSEIEDTVSDDVISFRFVPYGYDTELDSVVNNMVDGPFDKQLPLE